MKPVRIQQRRVKGWRLPENAVSVARPSRWGNWFAVRQYHDLWPGYADKLEFPHVRVGRRIVVPVALADAWFIARAKGVAA